MGVRCQISTQDLTSIAWSLKPKACTVTPVTCCAVLSLLPSVRYWCGCGKVPSACLRDPQFFHGAFSKSLLAHFAAAGLLVVAAKRFVPAVDAGLICHHLHPRMRTRDAFPHHFGQRRPACRRPGDGGVETKLHSRRPRRGRNAIIAPHIARAADKRWLDGRV